MDALLLRGVTLLYNCSLYLGKFATCLFDGPPIANFLEVTEKNFSTNLDNEILGEAKFREFVTPKVALLLQKLHNSPSRGTFM